jgi:hypothetical protein
MLETIIAIALINPICVDSLDGARPKAVIEQVERVERPARSQPQRIYKGKLSGHQLRNLLADVGFEGESLKTAWAIVMRESRGNSKAFNGDVSTKDNSWGLFQINMLGDLGRDRRAKFNLSSNDDLLDPKTNATIAYRMSGRGSDFGAWGIGPTSYREDLTPHLGQWLRKYPQH